MTSKKGAIEDTKKATNIARQGPEKEVSKLQRFYEGVRGDLAQAVPGGPPSSRELPGAPPATKGMRHPHHFGKSRFLAQTSSTFRDHRKSRSITAIR